LPLTGRSKMAQNRKKPSKMSFFRPIAWCVMLAAGGLCAAESATALPAPPNAPVADAKSSQQEAVIPASVVPKVDPTPELFADALKALQANDLQTAQKKLELVAVSNHPDLSCRAELLAIRLIAQRGDVKTALSRLELFARRPEAGNYRYRRDALALWIAAKSGDAIAFNREWTAIQQNDLPHPDAEVASALDLEIERCLAAKDFASAANLLSLSLEYRTSDAERFAALRREFELRQDPVALAALAARFVSWFPDAEETANIQLLAADKLWKAQRFGEALKLWKSVANTGDYPLALRQLAFEAAAIAAEKSGDDNTARTMYQSLIGTSNGGFADKMKFGAYLLRSHDDAAAEALFRELWINGDARQREVAGANLLQVLIRMKRTNDALAVAAKLRDSKEFGRYAAIKLAELQEANQDLAAAREAYQYLAAHYPQDPLIGHVAYRIAFLATQLKLPTAKAELAAFAEKYPADPKAPRALLQIMQISGNADAAKPYFAKIAERYPGDPLFESAAIQQFYFEMAAAHDADVIALSEKYPKVFERDEFKAAADLARLHLYLAAEEWDDAKKLELSSKAHYAATDSGAEIAFVCGNIESTLGKYQEALADYNRAAQLRPVGELGERARGRIADMNYVLFAETQETSYLEQAEKGYRLLAETSTFPAIRLEAFCRLGRTLELSARTLKSENHSEESKIAYEKSKIAYDMALVCAKEMKARNQPIEAIWCYRSAYGAIRIRMRSSRRVEREAALRTIAVLEELKLGDYYEDFAALRRDINRKMTNNSKKR